MEVEVKEVMDRQKIADALHQVMDTSIEMLKKDKLSAAEFGKIKVIRTLGSHINAAVAMVQQETAQLRAALVAERMKQLGYTNPGQIGQ